MEKKFFHEAQTPISDGQQKKIGPSLFFSRHLDDIDNIELYGLDAPLVDSPENFAKISPAIEAIYQHIKQDDKKAVMFITSPRLRAKQTAEVMAEKLRSFDKSLRIRFSVTENFKASEQGKFIVPPEYKPGDKREGLALAGKIFTNESHGSFVGGIDNIDYRFGDPILLPDGGYKYPELLPYFSELGESHRETLLRVFRLVLASSEKYKKFLQSTEVVLVAHGQTFHLLRGLTLLGGLIKEHEIDFKKGDSAQLLWDIYMNSADELKVTGVYMPIEMELLGDDKMMRILKDEIDYLESNKR